jgi:hypothetical protein
MFILHVSKDAAADQISAKDKKDHNGLMPRIRHHIGYSEKSSVRLNRTIIDVQEVPPMLQTNKQRGNTASKVKQNGGVGFSERDPGIRVH